MKKTFTPNSSILKVRIAMLATLVVMLSAASAFAQCSVVGTGRVTGNVNFGSSNNWANPNRCTLSDDLHSRVQLQAGEVSKYLQVSDYGWVLPPAAIVSGIEVKVEGHQEDFTADFADASIVLTKAGVIASADRAGTGYYDDKDYVNTYGSSTDLWGTTWTPADIMDPGFGVLYSVTRLSGTGTYYMYVDYVEVTVYFTGDGCLLPVTYKAYDVTLEANKTVKIDWIVSSETNADNYVVERSTDGINFGEVGTVDAVGHSGQEVQYSYLHDQILDGTAYYRLRQQDLDGSAYYTEVRAVSTQTLGAISISTFPNPATDVLNIHGAVAGATAEVYDLSGRQMLSSTLASDISTIDVSSLPTGMYMLTVRKPFGKASQKFIVQ